MLEKKRKPLRNYKLPAVYWKPVAELAKWLKPVPWQVICTFTFGRRVSDYEAEDRFRAYINRVEYAIKADISYVRGHEKRFSGCGKPACGRHYHAVMASAAPLNPAFLEVLWTKNAGKPG